LFEPLQQMCSEKRVGEIYLFKTFNEDLQWSVEEQALTTESHCQPSTKFFDAKKNLHWERRTKAFLWLFLCN
jgi:hypothetical protein